MGPGGAYNFDLDAAGNLHIAGDTSAGGTKNFVMEDPDLPGRAIYYAALEGPEAGTYCRGTAKTVNGEALIDIPAHFAKVTEVEGLTVQITPRGGWFHLYTEEVTPGRLVVRDADGGDTIEFDYFVQGIRRGYLDYQVERPMPARAAVGGARVRRGYSSCGAQGGPCS